MICRGCCLPALADHRGSCAPQSLSLSHMRPAPPPLSCTLSCTLPCSIPSLLLLSTLFPLLSLSYDRTRVSSSSARVPEKMIHGCLRPALPVALRVYRCGRAHVCVSGRAWSLWRNPLPPPRPRGLVSVGAGSERAGRKGGGSVCTAPLSRARDSELRACRCAQTVSTSEFGDAVMKAI
eukprot:1490107-Pleurochrysis_carterae.AAC.2